MTTKPAAVPERLRELPRHIVLKENAKGTELCSQMRSNDVVVFRNSTKCHLIIEQNQRLAGVIVVGVQTGRVSVLDSAVLTSRSVRLVDCRDVEVVIEDADVRRIELWRCSNCKIVLVGDDVLLEQVRVIFRERCSGCRMIVAKLCPTPVSFAIRCQPLEEREIPATEDTGPQFVATVDRPPAISVTAIVGPDGIATQEGLAMLSALSRFTPPTVLPADRTLMSDAAAKPPRSEEVLASLAELEKAPYAVTDAEVEAQYDAERAEFEEPDESLLPKVRQVADALRHSSHCVVYSGAGISTSA